MLKKRGIRALLLAAVPLVVLWLLLSCYMVHTLTRRAEPPFPEPPPPLGWGLIENHRLKTTDGHQIGAWFIQGNPNAPSVLLLHAKGGSRQSNLNEAQLWRQHGCSVMMITFRAHGDSSGEFNDFGYSGRHDVIAAVDFLEGKRPHTPIVVHGKSMGAAAAIFAAQPLGDRVSGYILSCPYRDLPTAVRNRTAIYLPAPLAWISYKGLVLVGRWMIPDADKIAPVDVIETIPPELPVLIMTGSEDRHARPFEARDLYQRIKTHAQLVIFEGADHLQMHASDPERYTSEMLALLQNATQYPAASGTKTARGRAALNARALNR